jgi:hypothetical protein
LQNKSDITKEEKKIIDLTIQKWIKILNKITIQQYNK